MHRYTLRIAIAVWCLWAIGLFCLADRDAVARCWPIAPTMLVGSFIAGSTCAGGGAVAFPVMTLGFETSPLVARDFSLMIQTVGMGAASLCIVLTRIPIQWPPILWANLGGALGIVLGIELSGQFAPAMLKMFFVSLWIAFAFALLLCNRRQRTLRTRIEHYDRPKIIALVSIGVLGGLISGLTGSGLDIMTFSLLTLGFGLCESVGTPTSVIMMAINAAIGSAIRLSSGMVAAESINYWWCAVPVVVIGAPVGAWFIANKSRHFIVRILCISIFVQYVSALLIVPQSAQTLGLSATVICVGCLAFVQMARLSDRVWATRNAHA